MRIQIIKLLVMKKDMLESFIKNNRDKFDILEPGDNVWIEIDKKLSPKSSIPRLATRFIKIAAVFAFVILGSSIAYYSIFFEIKTSKVTESIDPEIQELIEAEAFYAQEVSDKLNEIRKCYVIYPELKFEIEDDLTELESMYKSLKSDLRDNISNKEVIEAMIENNRYRVKLVDEVLEQINC